MWLIKTKHLSWSDPFWGLKWTKGENLTRRPVTGASTFSRCTCPLWRWWPPDWAWTSSNLIHVGRLRPPRKLLKRSAACTKVLKKYVLYFCTRGCGQAFNMTKAEKQRSNFFSSADTKTLLMRRISWILPSLIYRSAGNTKPLYIMLVESEWKCK